MERNKKASYLILSIMVIVCIFSAYYQNKKQNEIKNSPSFTVGEILKFNEMPRSSSVTIYYEFEINGRIYKNDKVYSNISINSETMFTGKSFTIAYQNGHPDNNDILISDHDYDEYKLMLPDTLAWVRQYIGD